jgi:protocatechuate 3,4-dioxygenase, beta subunit
MIQNALHNRHNNGYNIGMETKNESRRRFLAQLGVGTALLSAAPGVFADELIRTPAQTEGPFYPDRLPLDTDNDLVIVNDALTAAVGEIVYLTGRILDAKGNPVRNATVEIWQVDNHGVYLHSHSDGKARQDANFQGFGRFATGSTGAYLFRTIKPVAYPGRTPHIHMMVKIKGQPKFTTQCYIQGEPQNERDGVLRDIRDTKARNSLIIAFDPLKDSRIGELTANFNIVLGYTPKI